MPHLEPYPDIHGHEPGKEVGHLGFAVVSGPQFGEREG
jgi:hypothetical protein